MWLELCDQAHIGSVVGIRDSIFSIRADPDSMIARHLNLISAKNQTWALLARQRMARELLATVGQSVPGPGPNALPALPFIPDRQPATTLNVPSRAAQHPMPAAPPQEADWPTTPSLLLRTTMMSRRKHKPFHPEEGGHQNTSVLRNLQLGGHAERPAIRAIDSNPQLFFREVLS